MERFESQPFHIEDIMEESWTTEQELTFLKKLGTYREDREPNPMRLKLLENYVNAARSRADWGRINRDTVMRFAEEKLAEARLSSAVSRAPDSARARPQAAL